MQTPEASRFIEFAELAVRADDEGAGTMHYPIDTMIDRGEITLETFVRVISSALEEAKLYEEFIPKERLSELGVPSSLLFDLVASNVVKFCEEVLDATSEANSR